MVSYNIREGERVSKGQEEYEGEGTMSVCVGGAVKQIRIRK